MRNVLRGATYNGYDLCVSEKCGQEFYVEILQDIEALLNYMTWRHARVFFVRFDLSYPDGSIGAWYPNDNVLFTRFIEALARHYTRHDCHPMYFWVRERSEETGQFHYHILLLLDSNSVQNGYGVKAKAIDLWQRCLGIDNAAGLVELGKPNGEHRKYRGIKIFRNEGDFQEVFGICYQWASYMAKCNTKGEAPANINEYGHSRIPQIPLAV